MLLLIYKRRIRDAWVFSIKLFINFPLFSITHQCIIMIISLFGMNMMNKNGWILFDEKGENKSRILSRDVAYFGIVVPVLREVEPKLSLLEPKIGNPSCSPKSWLFKFVFHFSYFFVILNFTWHDIKINTEKSIEQIIIEKEEQLY